MFTVLIIMTAGIILGYLIRRKTRIIRYIGSAINLAIYLLLFLLGISVGANETIIRNLGTLGLTAIALTAGAVAGSVGLSYFTYQIFFVAKE
ncbi:MAG: hypothetical protein A2509_05825 [Candidatus Edwardsbacteria bacterium RIFOXYD12_FULL_50_11]|uniref:DUF340 domain-containing protein n=1 Tax=Candidatus Edwardsbacteria bacterium GWF2_54_11 TaxID=1817851 RepID=A0A1F5R4W7_9BACT|nr:MAG: hypothetical protein A2502_10790 [Candidatus Edwardsbacteria bacterium RifOxyC12_full_54_24]OGF06946.1 MAG: hypothetical protein A2273_00275 [Candidatus Edwardsbacteria bacterium RifOxyA12_full_54_48]OGF09439.1 MAG: hypothetical protein A2024_00465 [Candidatus Edwardsbacteria bacterium GWF2_54_11]OGF11083.1 MAG: hypothetical protein A3K15_05640 [Candidatus Edwardsbacteria bacterium GWE2_54_12]OGF15418.1 MAG: hypothetical protein A2509_05825 [Candidatus Edwardsbacteria bacterium RIFOXYD1